MATQIARVGRANSATILFFVSCFFSRLRGAIVCGDRRIRSHLVKVLVQQIDASSGLVLILHKAQDKRNTTHPLPVDYIPGTPFLRYQGVPSQDITSQLPTLALSLLGSFHKAVVAHQQRHARLTLVGSAHSIVGIFSRRGRKGPNPPQMKWPRLWPS
jgi:hypothetical protein